MKNLRFHKTRIAPTPSGFLHLGNVYSFAVTTALAKKHGAKILLRIDDMDRVRSEVPYVQDVFDTLQFLGIGYDEGPRDLQEFERQYSQLHRLPLYNEALAQLKQAGKVYACTCSRADVLQQNAHGIYTGTCRHKNLPLDTPNACWRMETDNTTALSVRTPDGIINTTLSDAMRDFVVRKKDGFPAYQLTSVIDDVHFGVDFIVRGQDLWDSTLAQLYLASFLEGGDFGNTTFHHHPLMMAANGEKLSKSAGATSVQYLRKEGRSVEGIMGMVGLSMKQ